MSFPSSIDGSRRILRRDLPVNRRPALPLLYRHLLLLASAETTSHWSSRRPQPWRWSSPRSPPWWQR